MYFLLFIYTLLGAGIKYIDDAFDKKIFNKKIALILAPILGIIGAYAMIIDPVSATILLAVLVGVLIKGKVDNLAFIIGFITVIALVILTGVQFLTIPLILLSAAAVLDEIGNDYIDSKRSSLNSKKPTHIFGKIFLGQRWIMKMSIIFLVIMNMIPLLFIFAMLLFDYSYLIVNAYSQIKEEMTCASMSNKIISTIGYIFK